MPRATISLEGRGEGGRNLGKGTAPPSRGAIIRRFTRQQASSLQRRRLGPKTANGPSPAGEVDVAGSPTSASGTRPRPPSHVGAARRHQVRHDLLDRGTPRSRRGSLGHTPAALWALAICRRGRAPRTRSTTGAAWSVAMKGSNPERCDAQASRDAGGQHPQLGGEATYPGEVGQPRLSSASRRLREPVASARASPSFFRQPATSVVRVARRVSPQGGPGPRGAFSRWSGGAAALSPERTSSAPKVGGHDHGLS